MIEIETWKLVLLILVAIALSSAAAHHLTRSNFEDTEEAAGQIDLLVKEANSELLTHIKGIDDIKQENYRQMDMRITHLEERLRTAEKELKETKDVVKFLEGDFESWRVPFKEYFNLQQKHYEKTR